MLRQKKPNFIFIKIGFYILIFIAIIYTMRYTRGSGFADQLGIFFGPQPQPKVSLEQKANWCPEGVQLVAWVERDKFVTGSNQIKDICSLNSTGYSAAEIQNITWKPLLIAKDSQGKEQKLEADPNLTLLKSGDLIFKSPEFKSQLEKVFNQK